MKLPLLLILLCLSFSGIASECKMAFRHGILISPDQIRIQTADRTQYQINNDQQLFIQGELQSLSADDVLMLQKYSYGLRKFVPQVVGIAVDSMELGLQAIESMLVGVGSKAE